MGMKEDIIEMKKEVQEIKEQSLAMELLKDSKRANKRLAISFTIVLAFILTLWFATICYLVYILNDIGMEEITTETTTQEISDVETIDSSYIINGDNYGKDKAN